MFTAMLLIASLDLHALTNLEIAVFSLLVTFKTSHLSVIMLQNESRVMTMFNLDRSPAP